MTSQNWNKEAIKAYYIHSFEDIPDAVFAERTGVTKPTFARWKKEEQWESQREQFRARLSNFNDIVNTKFLTQFSDFLSKECAELAMVHKMSYQKFRELTDLYLRETVRKVEGADDRMAELKKLNWREINLISQISDRAIRGEAAVTGMHFQITPALAYKTLAELGYEIYDPSKIVSIQGQEQKN